MYIYLSGTAKIPGTNTEF